MRTFACAGLALATCGAVLVAQGSPQRPAPTAPAAVRAAAPAPDRTGASPKAAISHEKTSVVTTAEQSKVVGQYCATCHSDRGKAGGLSLAGIDAAKVTEHPEVTEKIIRKLRAGMMPPAGARRPSDDVLHGLVVSFETAIDAAAARTPNPGRRPFQRLNRAEYAAAVHDLLDLDVDVTAYLPADTISADPMLAPLADNGGPSPTHLLQRGSPAIDRGSNLLDLRYDQRGRPFARVRGGAADIGATESRFRAE